MEIPELKKIFLDTFGDDGKELRAFEAPGRVNLIGEHIDYCGGCVLPMALGMKTTLIARRRRDNVLRLKATDLDVTVETDIEKIEELCGKLFWGEYQLGTALELIKDGYDLCGCDLLYHDTVPHGSGLSSSAATEVSTALALSKLSGKETDMIKLARISQMAEKNFVGVECGIMDQFASAMGKRGHAIFLDCKTLSYEYIPLDIDGYKIVITNTNVKHALGSSEYNERRRECREGLSGFMRAMSDISELSEVSPEAFEENKGLIKNLTTQKRVRHIVYECERVKLAAGALKSRDLALFGELMNKSHESLRDDYEVSCPELDFIVKEGQKLNGVLGVRMTGGGFGGCAVALVGGDAADNYIDRISRGYREKFSRDATFYITEAEDGAHEVFI
ncbi:MAG: galactokinase [Oscillospiraceae bacterium]|nr:galactokinase [Oscillospiraceae bacterium]